MPTYIKRVLTVLIAFGLGTAIWFPGYLLGCFLLDIPLNNFMILLYVLLLWFVVPALPFIFYWKRMVRQEGGALSPCHYGLLVGAAFLLWVPLSLIMGLGPCYRYVLIESGSFGGMILSIVTLPLLFFETVGIIVVMKMPVLLLTFTGIGFSIGTVFAYTKRRFARHNLSNQIRGNE